MMYELMYVCVYHCTPPSFPINVCPMLFSSYIFSLFTLFFLHLIFFGFFPHFSITVLLKCVSSEIQYTYYIRKHRKKEACDSSTHKTFLCMWVGAVKGSSSRTYYVRMFTFLCKCTPWPPSLCHRFFFFFYIFFSPIFFMCWLKTLYRAVLTKTL